MTLTELDPYDEMIERILEGAAIAFSDVGPRKSSMELIARTAGVGRQTVYRRFANKEEIIENLFVRRANLLLEEVLSRLPTEADIEDKIIDVCLLWVSRIKSDTALSAIIEESDSHDTELFLVGGHSLLQNVAEKIWHPILKEARATGALRRELCDERAVQYVRATHYLLHIRDDLGERERVAFVKDTLLTTLLRDSANKYSTT